MKDLNKIAKSVAARVTAQKRMANAADVMDILETLTEIDETNASWVDRIAVHAAMLLEKKLEASPDAHNKVKIEFFIPDTNLYSRLNDAVTEGLDDDDPLERVREFLDKFPEWKASVIEKADPRDNPYNQIYRAIPSLINAYKPDSLVAFNPEGLDRTSSAWEFLVWGILLDLGVELPPVKDRRAVAKIEVFSSRVPGDLVRIEIDGQDVLTFPVFYNTNEGDMTFYSNKINTYYQSLALDASPYTVESMLPFYTKYDKGGFSLTELKERMPQIKGFSQHPDKLVRESAQRWLKSNWVHELGGLRKTDDNAARALSRGIWTRLSKYRRSEIYQAMREGGLQKLLGKDLHVLAKKAFDKSDKPPGHKFKLRREVAEAFCKRIEDQIREDYFDPEKPQDRNGVAVECLKLLCILMMEDFYKTPTNDLRKIFRVF